MSESEAEPLFRRAVTVLSLTTRMSGRPSVFRSAKKVPRVP
jgi:hypothetical protein